MRLTISGWALLLFIGPVSIACEDRPLLDVHVADPDGVPVSGARITPWAIRSARGHGLWREDLHGTPPEVITDQDGHARVPCPQFHLENAETTHVSVDVIADGFCIEHADLAVPAPEPVSLRRGTRLRIAVTEADGRTRVPKAHFVVADESLLTPLFERTADGWYQSRPLPPEQSWLYAVQLSESGPRFSPPVHWDPDDSGTHEFVLPVEPGVRVEGRLDDAVPRPVRNGRVTVCATNSLTIPQDCTWWDVADIEPDGTFVFPSLPRDGDLQLMAVCDGFVSIPPSDAEIEVADIRYGGEGRVFPRAHYPQILAAREDVLRPVVKMEPAGVCRIRVVDPDGKPVSGVRVGFGVTQIIIPRASLALGVGHRFTDVLTKRVIEPIGKGRFQRVTSDEGVVEFDNLPVGAQSFRISDGEFHRYSFNGDDTGEVTVSPDRIAEVTATLDEAPQSVTAADGR